MCNSNKRTPRKHAALIHAWADGAEIQFERTKGDWIDVPKPEWYEIHKYRIKPEQSDLEKYGVEVGGVWCVDKAALLVYYSSGNVAVSYLTGDKIQLNSRDTLIFRRGVVNKL